MYYALKNIETAIELGQQTTRIRNVLDRSAFDKMAANCARALKEFDAKLEKALSEE
jgi:hypothetical protein